MYTIQILHISTKEAYIKANLIEDLLFYFWSMDLIVCNIFKPNKMNSTQNVTLNYPTLTLVI